MHKNRRGSLKVFAVILIGGKGKRLRPITTLACPKAFLPITKSDQTMFKKTLNRILKLMPAQRVMIVANMRHFKLIVKDFPGISDGNLLMEPIAKNTAPAIALAAMELKRRFGDAVMLVLPADHYIADDKAYIRSIKSALNFINSHIDKDLFMVFGIRPTFPATVYGYIKMRQDCGGGSCVQKVDRFVEKPDRRTAEKFLKDGSYFWNSGMFVFKASTILSALKMLAPDIYSRAKNIGKVKLDALYKKMPNISIDYAVMEKANPIYCVEGDYGWEDVGSLTSLKEALERELCSADKPLSRKTVKPSASSAAKILERLRRKMNT